MKEFLLGIGRLLLLAAIAVAGLVGGFFVGEMYCVRFVVPEWVKQYPHDGQLGLGVLGYALIGAFVGLVVAGIVAVNLILRFSRDRQLPEADEEGDNGEQGDSPIQLHLN